MKRLLTLLVVLAAVPALALGQVTINPTEVPLNLRIGENATINVSIFNPGAILDNVVFYSNYTKSYSPVGTALQPNSTTNFTVTVAVNSFNGTINGTQSYVPVNGVVYISATNVTETVTLGQINLPINLTLAEANLSTRDYFFKKCFLEGQDEFCTQFNTSDIQNLIVLNETVTYQNVTWDLMVPYNLTRQFMEEYKKSLERSAEAMDASRAAIENATNTMIYIQMRTDNMYKNAMFLEGYLKNENIPLWVQTAPTNMLMNFTGIEEEPLTDALNYLFQEGKLTQKIEEVTVSLQMADGSTNTKNIQKVYIASKERMDIEENLTWSYNVATVGILIAVVSVGLILFYMIFWRKRVSSLKA